MTRAEMKTAAKAQLGNNIFGGNWMIALLVCLIESVVLSAAATVTAGIAVILVAGPLSVGLYGLFLRQTYDGREMKIEALFDGFKTGLGENMLLGLMESIFVFLWSLLFVIPGIVKMYAYRMAYYIRKDHPEYGWKQCLDESQAIMRGHKWDLFVLDLSFIGWYFVGGLAFGIGMLWVAPYHLASDAQFYRNICWTTVQTVSDSGEYAG